MRNYREKSHIINALQSMGIIKDGEVMEHRDMYKNFRTKLTEEEFDYVGYYRDYLYLEKMYKEDKSWGEPTMYAYEDEPRTISALLDLVEKKTGIYCDTPDKFVQATQLKSLMTYVTGKDSNWEEPKSKQQGEENLHKYVNEMFASLNYSSYLSDLHDIVQNGGKYKDLLELDPAKYNLSEPFTEDSWRAKTKYDAINRVLEAEFSLGEPGGLMLFPSLRKLSKLIDAPYSVLMDAYKTTVK